MIVRTFNRLLYEAVMHKSRLYSFLLLQIVLCAGCRPTISNKCFDEDGQKTSSRNTSAKRVVLKKSEKRLPAFEPGCAIVPAKYGIRGPEGSEDPFSQSPGRCVSLFFLKNKLLIEEMNNYDGDEIRNDLDKRLERLSLGEREYSNSASNDYRLSIAALAASRGSKYARDILYDCIDNDICRSHGFEALLQTAKVFQRQQR